MASGALEETSRPAKRVKVGAQLVDEPGVHASNGLNSPRRSSPEHAEGGDGYVEENGNDGSPVTSSRPSRRHTQTSSLSWMSSMESGLRSTSPSRVEDGERHESVWTDGFTGSDSEEQGDNTAPVSNAGPSRSRRPGRKGPGYWSRIGEPRAGYVIPVYCPCYLP